MLPLHINMKGKAAVIAGGGKIAARRLKTVLCTVETLAGTVESEKIENPSLIVIGDVVQFSSQLSWFEPELKDPALSEAL